MLHRARPQDDAARPRPHGAHDLAVVEEDVLAAVGKASQAAPPDAGTARKGKESPGERFDGMLGTFNEWESRLGVKPEVRDDDRLGRVLLGCFAGSKVPEIVEALKVCYVDFKPLRVAGDLVFKIVGEVVERRSPK